MLVEDRAYALQIAQKINKNIQQNELINSLVKKRFSPTTVSFQEDRILLNTTSLNNLINIKEIESNEYTESMYQIVKETFVILVQEGIAEQLRVGLLNRGEFNYKENDKKPIYTNFFLIEDADIDSSLKEEVDDQNRKVSEVILPTPKFGVISGEVIKKMAKPIEHKEGSATTQDLIDDTSGKNDADDSEVYYIDPNKREDEIELIKTNLNSSDTELITPISDTEQPPVVTEGLIRFIRSRKNLKKTKKEEKKEPSAFNYQPINFKKVKSIL